jgi:hypothetical protein
VTSRDHLPTAFACWLVTVFSDYLVIRDLRVGQCRKWMCCRSIIVVNIYTFQYDNGFKSSDRYCCGYMWDLVYWLLHIL